MQPHNAKQEALEAIQRLPDTTDLEEIMYRLYVLERVRKAREDVSNGRVINADDLRNEIQPW